MRKVYFFIFIFLASAKISFAQYTWNGSFSSYYTDAANWTPARNTPTPTDILTFNLTAPLIVDHVANETISGIVVTGSYTVSLEADNPANVLTISGPTPLIVSAGSSLTASQFLTIQLSSPANFSSGTFGIEPGRGGKIIVNSALTLSGGKLDFDVLSTGGTTISNTGSIINTSGIFTCVNAAAITWVAGAIYEHKRDASAIPVSTWQTGSFCNITGITGAAPAGLSIVDFANFSWNCPTQSSAVNLLTLPDTSIAIRGSLSIVNTSGQYLRLAGAGGTTNTTLITAGSYNQTGGNVMLQYASGITNLTVTGAFSHSGGVIDGVGGASAGTGTLNLKGNVTKSATSTWQQSFATNPGAQMNIQFSGGAPQNVSIAGAWTAPSAGRSNIVVSNNDLASGVLLSPASILQVYNTNSASAATCTMVGKITPVSGTPVISYVGAGSGGLTLVYSGSSTQIATAVEFPSSGNKPTNLTINNTLGVTFPGSFNRIIPGTLTLLAGNLAIGDNTLELTNLTLSAQLTYGGGYVTTGISGNGKLGRYFPSSGLPVSANTDGRFPLGTGANDRSIYVFFSSASSGGTAGMIYINHTPKVTVTPISLADNGITLDKRTDTKWTISTIGFALGATTIALNAVGANIGAVDSIAYLRLTDGITPDYGSLINTIGTTSVPIVGKSGLGIGALNNTYYFGSNGTTVYNPLIIITFTWTGSGNNTTWTNPLNWSAPTTVGYPSAPTEIAIITSTMTGFHPTINTLDNISVYQLTVGSGMTLTMVGNAVINVFDAPNFTGGLTSFAPTSTFGYASSSNPQNILDIAYGSLSLSGSADKIFPATVTITGLYNNIGSQPNVILNSNTFVYAGPGTQNIQPANYYNLKITGNRGGGIISLGTLGNISVPSTIDIANTFDVSGLSNFNYPPLFPLSFNKVNFSSSGSQTIPGFKYALISSISSVNNSPRTLDPLGSSDINHVIYCREFNRGYNVYTVANSKVNFYVSGTGDTHYALNARYHDLEFSGNLNNYKFAFLPGSSGPIWIAGKLTISLTNFQQAPFDKDLFFIFNGTADQTITGFKSDVPSNTPAFKYPNIIVDGGNKNVTLQSSDTIIILGTFQVPRTAYYVSTPGWQGIGAFGSNKGFIVTGSTVNFGSGPGGLVPYLIPSIAGSPTYNNLTISGGSRILESNNMTLAGNLFVNGNILNASAGTSPAELKIGNGTAGWIFNVLGDVSITGTGAGINGKVDLNPGTSGSTTMNIAKSLLISGQGQLTGTGESNGTIVFKGTLTHNYTNTSTLKNGLVNFNVGDGITTNTKLTLLSSLDLVRSATAPNIGTLTVLPTDTLDCGIYSIVSNNNNGSAGNAKFDLQANSGLITANTGGIEGPTTAAADGAISDDGTVVRTYDPTASYTFNASSNTNTNFPAATTPFPMANLTIGNNVNAATFSLNKSIVATNTFTLKINATLALLNNDFTLKSTATATARVAAVPAGATVTYGNGRFNVERYYPSRRSWRLVTSPLSATGSIFSTWQNSGVYAPGIGTWVTDPSAPANGFDASPQNNVSMKMGSSLTPIPNTSMLLSGSSGSADNLAFFLFVRGDRNPTNFNIANSNITTLSSRGKLQIGSQSFNASPTPGPGVYALIGNPYASQINYFSTNRTNLTNVVVLWDPYLSSSLGGYIYVTVNGSGNVSDVTPASPGNLATNGQPLIIQSSQAFWVQTTGSGASVVFNEPNKSATYNPTAFREITDLTKSFRTNLYLVEPSDTLILADGNFAQFDNQFSSDVNLDDVLKFTNIKETFAYQRSGKALSIERRPEIMANDTLFFKITRTEQRNYQFEFVPANMDNSLTAFLEDNYKNTKTIVSLTSASIFNFTINGDAASAEPNRFKIVFKASAGAPLPVTYKSIKAYQQGNNIAVDWSVENEINISKYEVEKSTDGINFTKVNTTTAKGISGSVDYKFVDNNAVQGNNFYRILSYNQSGAFDYSRVVVVKLGKTAAGLSIYPNPVTGNTIGLAMTNMAKGIYQFRLINTGGQTFMTKKLTHGTGNSMETLTPDKKMNAGIYHLEVTAPDKSISTIKVIVQ